MSVCEAYTIEVAVCAVLEYAAGLSNLSFFSIMNWTAMMEEGHARSMLSFGRIVGQH
jgi:hypothetical protein